MPTRPSVYLAGPDVFRPDATARYARMESCCARLGLAALRPSDGGPSDPAGAGAAPPGTRGARKGVRAMLLLRDNLANRRAIERAYLKAIGGARREVLIANAYFFPGRRVRRALREAARRGVRVRLLL
ncbi:MAG TPA: nucleoside 2-deoxyribosyltransferase, partial [Burkholderiaceae bacterium]|nr:nucleoside 2-deoxyribosyltransferase [Burkholderiaceae bacterium]